MFSLGGKKTHSAEIYQSKNEQVVAKRLMSKIIQHSVNEQGVPKCHDGKMVQIDTLTDSNFIDLLSSLSDGQKAIAPVYLSEQLP
ncbi:hypothetical protein NQT74_08985 [Alteromonas stellipolaris]|nr:hypothetical protein [Alteromonas stellipolaris]